MRLDEIDQRILRILQNDGRIANADLAQKINLSASACHRRLHRLEQENYILNYTAALDTKKLDLSTLVIVEIKLSTQADDVISQFEKAVERIPNVLECHLMAGAADYILKIIAADTDDFARIHKQFLTRLPGVSQMQSSFALRTVFKSRALPI